ncbi:DUF2075 domain-containing protein [Kutzneria albida]|uniref:AAA+ ATPase domain-containing protein n=1 Tax=Kutzneria albida DSM 43870 TaxID=1449976 RepID=W5WCV9_9PSEU|nr:DUF2075 domain-containing protein [Kutzneria albida]AHH98590.1 hypothetical protein KALB_5228 [Kutzneria albida DSM 43870]
MSLLRTSAHAVLQMSQSGTLVERLATQFFHTHGHKPSPSEKRSWEASLPILAHDLVDAGLGQVEALIEYPLPLSSLRADVVLSGIHPVTGLPSYVVVELKQWGTATTLDDAPDLCTTPSYGKRALLHPLAQVRRYREYLTDFTRVIHDRPDAVTGIAYLHNASDNDVATLFDLPDDAWSRLFTQTSRGELISYLKTLLSPTNEARVADTLVKSPVAPSKPLMAMAAEAITQQQTYVLLDEQEVAYRLVERAVRRAQQRDHKEVIVITGGPGSGKSVIALCLQGELYRLYRDTTTTLHATGSKAFTTTLRKIAGKGNTRVQKLFQYFNSFSQAEHNGLTVLICDEAHRIRETSNNRYTPAAKRSDKPQVAELIDAARVPVFLLDEHQVVRPGEMGTVAQIEAAAKAKGLTVSLIKLDGQFRCGGSRKYEQWVRRLLGLTDETVDETGETEQEPVVWDGDDRFTLQVADSPAQMEKLLADQADKGYTARITAGFCWPWSDSSPDKGLPEDVVIGDWRKPWNVKGDRGVNGAPPSQMWATDPAGFGQVGCIYTAQGFEYDHNGVIFGPDLVWRTDRWVANPKASKDSVVARAKPEDYEKLIRHTYKVLLTRGMIGTILYSTDSETQAKLHSLVKA